MHVRADETAEHSNHRVVRNREKPVQKYRLAVQIAFALLCIWIGVQFHFFVRYLESTGTTTWVSRPPGAEGFLPISSLMSLYYFFLSGSLHPAHPAGVFIFVGITVMSLLLGKAFCSWLCPVGFLSEALGDLGRKVFGRELTPPRFLDYPLRGLKYILLAFFLYAIFLAMNRVALLAFLDSPYNKVADIKMYYFFADISQFALIVLVALVILSVLIRNFWCRYLCPYGALLGILAFLSPNKIKRNAQTCIDCGKCARVCPARIKVDQLQTVISDECTSCLQCVDACPVADTLGVKNVVTRRRVSKKLIAAISIGSFLLITGIGMLTGHWQNDISREEYIHHEQFLNSYGHPTGSIPLSSENGSTERSPQRKP